MSHITQQINQTTMMNNLFLTYRFWKYFLLRDYFDVNYWHSQQVSDSIGSLILRSHRLTLFALLNGMADDEDICDAKTLLGDLADE